MRFLLHSLLITNLLSISMGLKAQFSKEKIKKFDVLAEESSCNQCAEKFLGYITQGKGYHESKEYYKKNAKKYRNSLRELLPQLSKCAQQNYIAEHDLEAIIGAFLLFSDELFNGEIDSIDEIQHINFARIITHQLDQEEIMKLYMGNNSEISNDNVSPLWLLRSAPGIDKSVKQERYVNAILNGHYNVALFLLNTESDEIEICGEGTIERMPNKDASFEQIKFIEALFAHSKFDPHCLSKNDIKYLIQMSPALYCKWKQLAGYNS